MQVSVLTQHSYMDLCGTHVCTLNTTCVFLFREGNEMDTIIFESVLLSCNIFCNERSYKLSFEIMLVVHSNLLAEMQIQDYCFINQVKIWPLAHGGFAILVQKSFLVKPLLFPLENPHRHRSITSSCDYTQHAVMAKSFELRQLVSVAC